MHVYYTCTLKSCTVLALRHGSRTSVNCALGLVNLSRSHMIIFGHPSLPSTLTHKECQLYTRRFYMEFTGCVVSPESRAYIGTIRNMPARLYYSPRRKWQLSYTDLKHLSYTRSDSLRYAHRHIELFPRAHTNLPVPVLLSIKFCVYFCWAAATSTFETGYVNCVSIYKL